MVQIICNIEFKGMSTTYLVSVGFSYQKLGFKILSQEFHSITHHLPTPWCKQKCSINEGDSCQHMLSHWLVYAQKLVVLACEYALLLRNQASIIQVKYFFLCFKMHILLINLTCFSFFPSFFSFLFFRFFFDQHFFGGKTA